MPCARVHHPGQVRQAGTKFLRSQPRVEVRYSDGHPDRVCVVASAATKR
ncbi:hypothetical protein [Streptomyces sp. MS2.AVA.5]|uniref:Uncharacterized protein n=1 Tax=Streptomyces achmelvichensis TaxID=3134111 RepID=A0ACC6Q9U5_9ACTN